MFCENKMYFVFHFRYKCKVIYRYFTEEGRPLFFPCTSTVTGAFVSVHVEAPVPLTLSICEAFVYTDQGNYSYGLSLRLTFNYNNAKFNTFN